MIAPVDARSVLALRQQILERSTTLGPAKPAATGFDGALGDALKAVSTIQADAGAIRRERRQEDGAPELKAQIRRSQIAAASRRMKKTMAEATVVVVNPAHFAIALRYRVGVDAAPVLVEKGREITAAAIRAVAAELKIPVVRAPRLARAVYFSGRIGDTVREELFGAVAIVIAYVLSFDDADLVPTVAVPAAFDFDETGARRKAGTPAPL